MPAAPSTSRTSTDTGDVEDRLGPFFIGHSVEPVLSLPHFNSYTSCGAVVHAGSGGRKSLGSLRAETQRVAVDTYGLRIGETFFSSPSGATGPSEPLGAIICTMTCRFQCWALGERVASR